MVDPKQRDGTCTYCGVFGPITDDHIPPKNLFGVPRPSNLITVPSCELCRVGTPKDDEYFRNMIALRDDVHGHADARAAADAAFRGLRRPQQQGFRNAFLSTIKNVQIRSLAGLHLGIRKGYHVDLQRLDLVIGRIVRGLYFVELGKRLPPGAEVVSFNEDGLPEADPSLLMTVSDLVTPLSARESRVIGENAFSYKFVVASDAEYASAWMLTFYDRVRFLALTLPAELVPPAPPGAV